MAFKRILCAVDFSPESVAAFHEAVDLARSNSAKLFMLHALEIRPVISQWLEPDSLGDATLEMEQRAKESMESLLNSLPDLDQLSIHTEIDSGRAYVEILENARVWDADLVVLGARGTGTIADIVMGSTAERVMKDAECSVLVVRSDKK